MKQEKDVWALDTETANGLHRPLEIASIAIAKVYGSASYSSFVKPKSGEITADSTAINGITKSMLNEAPSFIDVWKEIEKITGGSKKSIFVAHNAVFDFGAIEDELDRWNEAPFGYDYICTMEIAEKCFPETENNKLETLYRFFKGEDISNAHDALVDARACGLIAKTMATKSNMTLTTLAKVTGAYQTAKSHHSTIGINSPSSPHELKATFRKCDQTGQWAIMIPSHFNNGEDRFLIDVHKRGGIVEEYVIFAKGISQEEMAIGDKSYQLAYEYSKN